MNGPSHARIAAAVGAVAGHLAGAEAGFAASLRPFHLPAPVEGFVATGTMVAVCGALGGIAGLLPDLDTKSTLGDALPGWWHALTPGHRGSSHSLIAVALWWTVTAAACAGLGITGRPAHLLPALVVAGVVSHLVADALTDHGIRPLYPLRWHLRSPLAFRTGSWPEPVVVTLVVLAAVVWLAAPLVHGRWA